MHKHECPPPSGSGTGTRILVAIQHFHIISTEVFEMLNVGVCAFECDCRICARASLLAIKINSSISICCTKYNIAFIIFFYR